VGPGTIPVSITVDPSGRFVYVANSSSGVGGNSVSVYNINPGTGELTFVDIVSAGTRPVSVVVDPSGRFVYVANLTSGDVSAYAIYAATGALTSICAPVAAVSEPTSVSVDPSGKFVYVTNSSNGVNGNSVSVFSIDTATGALTSAGTATAGTNPASVATTGNIQ